MFSMKLPHLEAEGNVPQSRPAARKPAESMSRAYLKTR